MVGVEPLPGADMVSEGATDSDAAGSPAVVVLVNEAVTGRLDHSADESRLTGKVAVLEALRLIQGVAVREGADSLVKAGTKVEDHGARVVSNVW